MSEKTHTIDEETLQALGWHGVNSLDSRETFYLPKPIKDYNFMENGPDELPNKIFVRRRSPYYGGYAIHEIRLDPEDYGRKGWRYYYTRDGAQYDTSQIMGAVNHKQVAMTTAAGKHAAVLRAWPELEEGT